MSGMTQRCIGWLREEQKRVEERDLNRAENLGHCANEIERLSDLQGNASSQVKDALAALDELLAASHYSVRLPDVDRYRCKTAVIRALNLVPAASYSCLGCGEENIPTQDLNEGRHAKLMPDGDVDFCGPVVEIQE